MAGTVSKYRPVDVGENRTVGKRAYSRLVEDNQQFGDYSRDAIHTLEMWRDVWAPALAQGVRQMGGLSLKPLATRALQMGDELHNRTNAASSLFAAAVAAPMVKAGVEREMLSQAMSYICGQDNLFLGLSMAYAKAATAPARHLEHSP